MIFVTKIILLYWL